MGVGVTIHIVNQLRELFTAQNWSLSVAESCTGGRLAATLVEQPGASDFFHGGVISYTDEIKSKVLEVSDLTLSEYGAVSKQVALQMARGVCKKFNTTWSVSTTGFAGPNGGSGACPVGSLYVSVVGPKIEWVGYRVCEASNRNEFIQESVEWALRNLLERSNEEMKKLINEVSPGGASAGKETRNG